MHAVCEGCRCPCHSVPPSELSYGPLVILDDPLPAKISEQSPKIPERKRGAPVQIPEDVRSRILELHSAGRAYTWIAAQLNREKVPTVRASKWHAATIRNVVLAADGDIRQADS